MPDDGVWMGGRLAALFEGKTWEWRHNRWTDRGSPAPPPAYRAPRGPGVARTDHPLTGHRGRTLGRPRRSHDGPVVILFRLLQALENKPLTTTPETLKPSPSHAHP